MLQRWSTQAFAPSNSTPVNRDVDFPETYQTSVAVDVNGDGQMSVLRGYDDWAQTTAAGVTRLTNMQLGFQCGTGTSGRRVRRYFVPVHASPRLSNDEPLPDLPVDFELLLSISNQTTWRGCIGLRWHRCGSCVGRWLSLWCRGRESNPHALTDRGF